jgi:hypothetical protein
MRKTQAKKYRRKAAAAYLSESLGGVPISDRSLESWDIPFQIINGYAVYSETDLDVKIQQMLAESPRRTGRTRNPVHNANIGK